MSSSSILHVLRLLLLTLVAIAVALTFIGLTIRDKTGGYLNDDLANSKKLLLEYKAKHSKYPQLLDSNNCFSSIKSGESYCLEVSSGVRLDYQPSVNEGSFILYASKNKVVKFITQDSDVVSTELFSACPSGYIPVPGSAKYGTSDFCVMKYEAKCATSDSASQALDSPLNRDGTYENWTVYCNEQSGRELVSVASGPPVALITFDQAVNYSKKLCSKCHLVREAEWQTIAENVLKVPENYLSGIQGEGLVFKGHTDSDPNIAIEASDNDNEGYYKTGPYEDMTQRRTLKLTNGQVIWDFTGNVWEWTQAQNIDTLQFGIPSYAQSISPMWYNAYLTGTALKDLSPNGVGLSSQSGWLVNHNKGLWPFITDESKIRGFTRGGFWGTDKCEGMKIPYISNAPSGPYTGIGLRVAI